MNFLKQYRKEYAITQKELAKNLNISLRRYRSYEQGTRTIPEEIFIEVLKEWKTYPYREKIINVLEWYKENKKGEN
jgi:transcriptional regulator with XRE-family HTH domain